MAVLGPPPAFRIPGLTPAGRYTVARLDPGPRPAYEPPPGPLSGAALAGIGRPVPPPAPLTTTIVHLRRTA
ncbi:hypothetical protein [Dactylosporangium sp. NPDC049140]|uniref:hypothetical protein n=1 Tax=Dactylosporangium sp. NPDC049140 TaxID=3155647 RepID=UPI003407EFBF